MAEPKSASLWANSVSRRAGHYKTVLNHQTQLPKGLLHGSLCPILLNMAGPKKLALANQSLPTCVFLKDIAECIVQSETDLFSASPTTFTQPLADSLTNILISKSTLVFLEQLQGKTPFLISHCIHDADSSFLGSLFVWILCDLISNGGSTRHQRYWFGAEGCVVGW